MVAGWAWWWSRAEDEIAAMNMAIGASFSGARSLVPTSGGGFALMTEGVSLAAVSETPLVCVVAMRPGPATGLPTRTEQADLNLVLHAGHGEFPRAILAPGTVQEAFTLAHRAFDLAERWQSPVFVLSDQFMADSFRAVEPFDARKLPEPAKPLASWEGEGPYERYDPSPTAAYRRASRPGSPRRWSWAIRTSTRPTATSPRTSTCASPRRTSACARAAACGKRPSRPPTRAARPPKVLLVSWGSTRGAAEEAAMDLRDSGGGCGVVAFQPGLAPQGRPVHESP